MKLWSENFGGNLHQTASILNDLGISDVIAMDCTGWNTVVVYRISDEEYTQKLIDRANRNAQVSRSTHQP